MANDTYKITAFAYDGNNKGVGGIKIKAMPNHDKEMEVRTDSSGMATFIISSPKVAVYIDSSTAFDGYTSDAAKNIISRQVRS